MSKVRVLLIIAMIGVVGLFMSSKYASLRKNLVEKDNAAINETSNDNSSCDGIDSYIDGLDKSIRQNKTITNIIKKNCLMIMGDALYFDVTGDNKDEIILNAGYQGCASCHLRNILVFQNDKLIFRKEGDDLAIENPRFPIEGFTITEPLRKHDESMCCASEGLVYTYIYSPKDNRDDASLVDSSYSTLPSYSRGDDTYFYLYDTRTEKNKR